MRNLDSRKDSFWSQRLAQHPKLLPTLAADARANSALRGEGTHLEGKFRTSTAAIRLAWVSDAFLSQLLYRFRTKLDSWRIPLLPTLLHHLSMITSQVSIGRPVVIGPGLYLIHGQVVIDGLVTIGSGAVIAPFVTIGLRAGNFRGATIGNHVMIGTGARVIGPVKIGDGATIGANAVVVEDVAAGATVAGIPATRIGGSDQGQDSQRNQEEVE